MPRRVSRLGAEPVTLRPSNRMSPLFGASAPEIMLNSVVLPAPFGPTTDITVFRGTVKDTSETATSPPNRFVSPRTSRMLLFAAPVLCPSSGDSDIRPRTAHLDHRDRRRHVLAAGRVLEADMRAERALEVELCHL